MSFVESLQVHFCFFFQEFECNAEDLRELNELGHGAYGYVYKMIHEPTGNIMAVKVS